MNESFSFDSVSNDTASVPSNTASVPSNTASVPSNLTPDNDSKSSNLPRRNRKGFKDVELAMEFLKSYPCGSMLTVEDFDKWCEGKALFRVPVGCTDKESGVWKVHLTKRGEVRDKIRNGGLCLDIRGVGGVPFTIVVVGSMMLVRSIEAILISGNVHSFIATRAEGLKKLIRRMTESDLWTNVPPRLKDAVENAEDETESLFKQIEHMCADCELKFEGLRGRLRRSIETKEWVCEDESILQVLGLVLTQKKLPSQPSSDV